MGDLGTLRSVVFGTFTLDAQTRQLLRSADRMLVHLSPKAFDLLSVLVETRPHAIAKAELHERLWPSTFVSEATLASLVGELRDALGQRGREMQIIRTVHGFGYAFAAETQELGLPSRLQIASWLSSTAGSTR